MTDETGQPTDVGERRVREMPRLGDLIDLPKLQAMQDLFAQLTGACVIVRDRQGHAVTHVSNHNRICKNLLGTETGRHECRLRSEALAGTAAGSTGPVARRCPSGLPQLAVPIQSDGEHLGSIIIGYLTPEQVEPQGRAELAKSLAISPEEVAAWLGDARPLPEPRLHQAVELLGLMANSLAELCLRGMEVSHTVRQLATLFDISQLLSSARQLDEVLALSTEALTKALDLKACSIRLLDDETGELTVRTSYNLSERYLKKGPVTARESPLDQEAMTAKVVQVPDISTDARFQYKQAMLEEGIRSIFYVGLLSRGEPLGALRLYSSVVRRLDASEERLFMAVANQVAGAIENARLYQEALEKDRLEYELSLASSIQEQLLPREQPKVPGYDIFGLSVPCELIGGDFYDFIPAPSGRLGLTIADGAGKGVPGALLMAIAHTALHVHTEHITSPREILARTNKQFCARSRPSQFVTLFYGLLNPLTATFTYANAGHNAPLLLREGRWQALEADGIILGVDENASFEQRELTLEEADLLVLYTDGVTEAINAAEQLFGVERLKAVLAANAASSCEEIAHTAVRAVGDFAHGRPQHDDITLVLVKVVSE
jgi:sigma-B regulation protein RsbU (phosphoserine phosphatase)